MNSRSLKFQLIVWYAGLVAACYVMLGVAVYLALEKYLVSALKHTQLRRAGQIALIITQQEKNGSLASVGLEIESRYAPAANDRFVRITQADGQVLYASGAPADKTFEPATLPSPEWSTKAASREI